MMTMFPPAIDVCMCSTLQACLRMHVRVQKMMVVKPSPLVLNHNGQGHSASLCPVVVLRLHLWTLSQCMLTG